MQLDGDVFLGSCAWCIKQRKAAAKMLTSPIGFAKAFPRTSVVDFPRENAIFGLG